MQPSQRVKMLEIQGKLVEMGFSAELARAVAHDAAHENLSVADIIQNFFGEVVSQDESVKTTTSRPNPTTIPASNAPANPIAAELVSMGFSPQHANQAAKSASNIENAVDIALSLQSSGNSTNQSANYADLNEQSDPESSDDDERANAGQQLFSGRHKQCRYQNNCHFACSFHNMIRAHPANWTMPTPRPIPGIPLETCGEEGEVKDLVHVTSVCAAKSIAQLKKMKAGKTGMFGGAIYFAESKEIAQRKAQVSDKRATIIASVYTGKSLVLRRACSSMDYKQLWRAGFDSVKAPGGQRGVTSAVSETEYAIYDSRQVLTMMVILPSDATVHERRWASNFVQTARYPSTPWVPSLDTGFAANDVVVTKTSTMSFNEFQHSVKGQGFTKDEIREKYYKSQGRQVPPKKQPKDKPESTPAPQPKNPWNAFQQDNRDQGWSKEKMLAEYNSQMTTPTKSRQSPPRTPTRVSNRDEDFQSPNTPKNPWNAFRHENRDKGWSNDKMLAEYNSQKTSPTNYRQSPPRTPRRVSNRDEDDLFGLLFSTNAREPSSRAASSPSTPQNSWNAFQQERRGQGMTRSEMSAAYTETRSSASSGSSSRASSSSTQNSWNAFQQQCGGQGMTRSEMSAAYSASKSGGSSRGTSSRGASSGGRKR